MSAGGKRMRDRDVDEMEQQLVREIEERQHKLAVLRDLKRKWSGEPEPEQKPKSARGRRGLNVKQILFDLLEQRGAEGLNATLAVSMAKDQGKGELDRGTVSSLLSRFKGEVAHYDGTVYRLNKYAPEQGSAPQSEGVVRFPTSKAAP